MQNMIFSQKESIGDLYSVTFCIKKGAYAETYRVKNVDDKNYFLKLIDYSFLQPSQLIFDNQVSEIYWLKKLSHSNIICLADSGELLKNQKKYAYLVLDFISGETLVEKLAREGTLDEFESSHVMAQILDAVQYLHSHHVIHNDLTSKNIMFDLSSGVEKVKIIDFGYARHLSNKYDDFKFEGIDVFFAANELYQGIFSNSSDLYSLGAIYYHMLEGFPPFYVDRSTYDNDEDFQKAILKARQRRLIFKNTQSEVTQRIITKLLQPHASDRFNSVLEVIDALQGKSNIESNTKEQANMTLSPKKPPENGGFSAIAGMDDLKEQLQLDVINALHEKKRYKEYGLTIPNGMLLYGPPGCGKTFFAERLAEEIGFSFFQIKPSDIQSKFVNESQELIKNLFEQAIKEAPAVIFIDELDAIVPSRDTPNMSQMNMAVVNEFLTQMNECGKKDIFVIGATNRPSAIDPAVRRAGRLDKHFYLPVPDFKARKQLFIMYLSNRPKELGLDYEKFSMKTVDYVSSDIKLLCDDSARMALRQRSKISNEIVFSVIANSKPSISRTELDDYLRIKASFKN